MIVRSGLALSIPVLFTVGHPDGAVNWRLYGTTGTLLTSGAAVVPADAVSINLPIASAMNTLATGSLYGSRDFEWDYTVGGFVVNGEQRYTIEARAPFGVSHDGVRAKLGVELKDLPDSDISLIRGYIAFRNVVGADDLALITDDAAMLSIRDAIEAQVALSLIPTMAVRIAVSEDSGTNAFKRQEIDWTAVAESLSATISDGILVVIPDYDPLAGAGALFILATPSSDPFTGGTYA